MERADVMPAIVELKCRKLTIFYGNSQNMTCLRLLSVFSSTEYRVPVFDIK